MTGIIDTFGGSGGLLVAFLLLLGIVQNAGQQELKRRIKHVEFDHVELRLQLVESKALTLTQLTGFFERKRNSDEVGPGMSATLARIIEKMAA